MLEAADFRSQARGEGRIDVEREIERLLAGEEPTATSSGRAGARSGSEAGDGSGGPGRTGGQDPPEVGDPHPTMETGVRAEVRQLVIANNERRERRGEEPLDVETEVERRMKEWG